MINQKGNKTEWLKNVNETALDDLRTPSEVVDFVEKIFTLSERHHSLYKLFPGQGSISFEELKEHVENGKIDLSSVSFVETQRQFLETATLFPDDPQFQVLGAASGASPMTPRDVSLKGVFEGLEYARWEREKKINLRGVDLSFMDFSGYCFFECDLSETNLDNTVFRNADLVNTNFSFANLTEADFSFADLTGANLQGAILTNALFHGTKVDKETAELILQAGGILEENALLTS